MDNSTFIVLVDTAALTFSGSVSVESVLLCFRVVLWVQTGNMNSIALALMWQRKL